MEEFDHGLTHGFADVHLSFGVPAVVAVAGAAFGEGGGLWGGKWVVFREEAECDGVACGGRKGGS
jgi:hypothetical protein